MGEGDQRHDPAALPSEKTRYSLYRRLVSPQGRSGRVRKISPSPGFDPRTIQAQQVAIPTELHGPQFWDRVVVIFCKDMISNVECLDSPSDVRPLKMDLPCCFEMSDTNSSVTSRRIPEERRLQFHRCKPTYFNQS